ncbi:MAG TPA: AAA family ATPase [Actinophytocola sp.]|jgi:tetratricopeptide (TPR) repeat protein|nr:AAA family ATPase [Actinophytocola sp.]
MAHQRLSAQDTGRLVGRSWPRELLSGAVGSACAGAGGLVLVTGEPGIGKTRLLSELDQIASDAGARLVRGTCWEGDGAPAFWPWIQVLRACLREGDPAGLARLDGVDEALRLVAERPADPGHADLDQTRFPLFDAVATLLRVVAAGRPLVVVLDDLHWADLGSLRLLDFLARGLPGEPLLVAGGYRDAELAADSEAGGLLAGLAARAHMLALSGLDTEEVGVLLAATTGATPTEDTAAAIRGRTAGNPLFVRELGRLLAARGRLSDVDIRGALPEGVRAVLRRRLARLSHSCHALLEVAAVVGADVGMDVLAAVAGSPLREVAERLDEAERARLVTPVEPGRYAFGHDLVRDTLCAGLPSARRAELHGRIGAALEDLDPGAVAALAHHFTEAAAGGADTADKAVDYSRRAGRLALDALAYEQAADHFQRALELRRDPGARIDLLLARGDALLRCGNLVTARADFTAAANVARAEHRPDDLARAALGFAAGLSGFEVRLWDATQIDLLEEALAALGDGYPVLRASTMARLSVSLSFVASPGRRVRLAEDAVALARQAGDEVALAQALAGHCDAIAGPAEVPVRLAEAGEIVAIAQRVRDRGLELLGRRLSVVALLETGDTAAADTEIAAFERVATAIRQPLYSWYVPLWRGMRAHLRGDLAEVRRCAGDAARVGAAAESRNARVLSIVLDNWAAVEEGELAVPFAEMVGELVDELPELAPGGAGSLLDLFPCQPLTPAVTAAMDNIAELIPRFPVDSEWMSSMCFAAWSVVDAGHRGAAAVLYDVLSPHAHRFAVDGIAVGSHGCAARHLGALAHLLGRYEDAEEHFELALAANRRALSPLLVAHTRRQYGAMLIDRGGPENAERAGELLRAALAGYREMGLVRAAEHTETLLGSVRSPAVPAGADGTFRLDGDYWTVSYAGQTVRLKNVKGLRDIARLLANPGNEIHALDLVGAPAGADTGELVDARARAEYRARLSELDSRIADGDEQAADEREVLIAHLTAAYGLGGRPRRAGDPAERARATATWRIRDAIGRVERAHPALGRHLRASIRTGTYCCYLPEEPRAWVL